MNFDELPMGFGMALAMNPTAMNFYTGMTVAEQEEILHRVKQLHSK